MSGIPLAGKPKVDAESNGDCDRIPWNERAAAMLGPAAIASGQVGSTCS